MECLDIDNHVLTAQKNISEFLNIPEVKEIFDKYKLPVQKTQSGGFHLLYRCDNFEGNKKLASIPIQDKQGDGNQMQYLKQGARVDIS